MVLALSLKDLPSRAARVVAVGNEGVRRIAVNATSNKEDGNGDVFSIYNGIEKFGQSLMRFAFARIADFFRIDWRKVWQQVTTGVRFLLNFDINTTDKQIDEQIKQAEIALAATKGSLAGQSLGFAICGLLPTATIAVFNEPLALYIVKELGEEAIEDISGTLATLVQLQIQQNSRKAFFNIFKNHRDIVRALLIGVAQVGVFFGQISQEQVDKANKERNKPWSIAKALEESIDEIKDPIDRAYAEELWDELGESCIEAGYIVANSADSYYALQKMANQNMLGTERIIEIQPVRNPDEATT
jgi:hypothetical protein